MFREDTPVNLYEMVVNDHLGLKYTPVSTCYVCNVCNEGGLLSAAHWKVCSVHAGMLHVCVCVGGGG